MKWRDAAGYCEQLPLAGGGWRLPSISELRTLVRGCPQTETGGKCKLTDNCRTSACGNEACQGCSEKAGRGPGGHYWPAELPNVDQWSYWSSTSYAVKEGVNAGALSLGFGTGEVDFGDKESDRDFVRCVR